MTGYQSHITVDLARLLFCILSYIELISLKYHEDLEKREEVWCGGARVTRDSRVTIGELSPKENIFSNLPAFQDLNGMK